MTDYIDPEGKRSWTNALCEACWISEEGQFEVLPEGDPHAGQMILAGVRTPVITKGSPLEQCCECGSPTIIGIYVRRNPDLVQFPRYEEPEAGAEGDQGDDAGPAQGVQLALVLEEDDRVDV